MAESFNKDLSDDEVTTDDDLTSSESDISEDTSTDEISEDSSVTGKISDKDHYDVTAEEKEKYESRIRSDAEQFENELKELEAQRDECTCPYAKNLVNITISLLIKRRESMLEHLEVPPWMKRGNQKLGESSKEDTQSLTDVKTEKNTAEENDKLLMKQGDKLGEILLCPVSESSKEDTQTLTDMKTEKNTAEENDNLLMKQGDKLGEETVTDKKPKKDSAGTSALGGSSHEQDREEKCMLDLKRDSSLKAEKYVQMSREHIIKSMSRSMHKAMIRSGSEISIEWLENELRGLLWLNRLKVVKVEDGDADLKGGKKTSADCEVKNNTGKEE